VAARGHFFKEVGGRFRFCGEFGGSGSHGGLARPKRLLRWRGTCRQRRIIGDNLWLACRRGAGNAGFYGIDTVGNFYKCSEDVTARKAQVIDLYKY
jgi:hypothetical protein